MEELKKIIKDDNKPYIEGIISGEKSVQAPILSNFLSTKNLNGNKAIMGMSGRGMSFRVTVKK